MSHAAALGRSSRTVLWLTAVAFVLALLVGHDVQDRLVLGGTKPIGSAAVRADELLRNLPGQGVPHIVLIARAARSVDDPGDAAAGRRLAATLAADRGVAWTVSYWTTGAPAMRSKDGRSALVTALLSGDRVQRIATARRLVADLTGRRGPLTVTATGEAVIRAETQERSQHDLRTAELIAAPLTLAILLVVFGGVVAALLPLLIGALSVVGAMAVLRLLTSVTEIGVFALSIATALGFALAVDFSLFIVTRFREELARGLDPHTAVAVTMRSTGRAMGYSAATVTLSLSALLLFPFGILRSIACGGIAITVLAAVTSLVVLPALLRLLGERVNRLPVPGPWRAGRPAGRRWYDGAVAVMRRPVVVALPVTLVLVTLGVPFVHVRFATMDDRVLPPQAPAAQAGQQLRRDFAAGGGIAPTTIVLPGAADLPALSDYARRISAVPGVLRVDTAPGSAIEGSRRAAPGSAAEGFRRAAAGSAVRGSGHAAPAVPGRAGVPHLTVTTAYEPYSMENSDLVLRLRKVGAPGPVLIGGPGGNLADTRQGIGDVLPVALALIALTTLALITALTGSIVLAVKALVMNALSLTATFGVLVHVFQDGHLRGLVGDFTVTGSIDILMPSMIFCVAFGLSMDYEIFLLSRITEEHRRTGDTVTAVARGLQHTGRLFTSAAVVFAVVMAALATSTLTPLKMIGVGLAVAVLLDATVIRALLVPAVMRLAGRANWWSPIRRRPPLGERRHRRRAHGRAHL
ncbi:MMPL family transporter [Nonomuraea phyllanthi]|uniref:MMPL family transporter n=1 Tax=Nonomuraea phyllanthi TaxID=2219224 RepID=A0A5C4WT75_9ACTN|nr:MMPL family transporter [Nonomuraea phyllanthi]KAB8196780.1 MMPL family transporter [Nonomuraea phyllanthi]